MERIRYYTMNSWNNATAPAYNLKIYNVIPKDLQDKVYNLMECVNFYDEINILISDFNKSCDYQWQASFNGRSGGYLVLYVGGYTDKVLYSKDKGVLNKKIKKVFSYLGQHIEDKEVSREVLNNFRLLAQDIVNYTIKIAKEGIIKEKEYTVKKTRQVIEA